MGRGWRRIADRLRTIVVAAAAGGAAAHPASAAISSVSQAELDTWTQATKAGSTDGYQRYLELYPTGEFAEQAFRKMIESSFAGEPRATTPPGGRDPATGLPHDRIVGFAVSLY
ncbi:MAG: hypothetical protein U1E45_22015 [Geminicoccaceae bacterium]